LLKRLHLANTRRVWRDLTQRAEQEEWTYRDLLALVVSEEIAQRQQTRIARLVRRARFPFLKTVDDFHFLHQSTVRLSLRGSALASEFVTEGGCVILSGEPGRGKTHLAVAIAYRAILTWGIRSTGQNFRNPAARISGTHNTQVLDGAARAAADRVGSELFRIVQKPKRVAELTH
jgi:DNA replication protein DnaC